MSSAQSGQSQPPTVNGPSGTRQRLDHVDAMRPIKQVAVISTHALIFFSPLSTSFLAASLLTLTHFSRNAFLFVSACMLAYSYRDQTAVALGHYWRRRFVAVGLVYLVWTLIYFPVASMTPTSTFPYYSLAWSSLASTKGLHNLLFATATGYYHLYFLLVLLEFYVVFPYVFALIRRYRRSHLWIVVGALVWQLAYPALVRRGWLGFVMPAKVETRLITSYPLYLLGGVVAAFYLEQFHDFVVRHRRGLLLATALCGAAALTLDYLSRVTHDLPLLLVPGGDPFAALVVPYDVGAIVAVYLLGVYLVAPGRGARTRAITRSGSEAAYGIYVSQLIWIIFLHRWAYEWGLLAAVPWLASTLFAVAFAYGAGWLFSAVVARTPFARALVGRSRQSWATLLPRWGEIRAHDDVGEGPLNMTDV